MDTVATKALFIVGGLSTNSCDTRFLKVILSGFKGNNKDGRRRRRLDYKLARKVILEDWARRQYVVDAGGFDPPAPWLQTRCSSKLS